MKLTKLIRNSAARLLFNTGLTNPAWCGKGRLSIVTFHRVLPETERQAYPYTGLVVTPEELDIFLNYFTRHFDCGTLASQHKRYRDGEKSARPFLAVTFDDAQYDNFKNARTILSRHKVKASFFVPVVAVEQQTLLWHDRLGFAIQKLVNIKKEGQIELAQILSTFGLSIDGPLSLTGNIVQAAKKLSLETRLRLVDELVFAAGGKAEPEFARLMTFDELAELASDGHEIGSHSMTHCMMPECNDDRLLYEVQDSRSILQNKIGQPVTSFCYPNGNANERTAHAVANAGYLRAVTTNWGNNGQDADQFQLKRYDMVAKRVVDSKGKFLPALLAFRMSGLYPGL